MNVGEKSENLYLKTPRFLWMVRRMRSFILNIPIFWSYVLEKRRAVYFKLLTLLTLLDDVGGEKSEKLDCRQSQI